MYDADMRFIKKTTPPDFQAKDFTPLISLNFDSFSDKNTKMSVFGEIYTTGKKIYTAGGSDKSHLWVTNAQFGETISFDRVVTKNCYVDPGRVN